MATKRLVETMSGNIKDKFAALAAPIQRLRKRRSAQQNQNPSRYFSPREEHQNEFVISLSKQKGQR